MEAVIEINGLFVQLKAYLRSYMLSVHAHESLPGDICHVRTPATIPKTLTLLQAFDNFSAALGYMFETLIGENGSEGDVSERIRTFLISQRDCMCRSWCLAIVY